MSTSPNRLSHAEIAREIRLLHPGSKATSNMVGQVRRGDTTAAPTKALVAEAIASLEAKAKAVRKGKRAQKAIAV